MRPLHGGVRKSGLSSSLARVSWSHDSHQGALSCFLYTLLSSGAGVSQQPGKVEKCSDSDDSDYSDSSHLKVRGFHNLPGNRISPQDCAVSSSRSNPALQCLLSPFFPHENQHQILGSRDGWFLDVKQNTSQGIYLEGNRTNDSLSSGGDTEVGGRI